jgi:hypothetical protein
MSKLPLFEDFIPVGFGTPDGSSYSLGANTSADTGYNMDAIVGPVMEASNCIAKEAYSYESNDNPEHKAESYIKEAKKHFNEKIDEAYEKYSATNEAMVQIAGDKKPSGAQVLATVLIDYMIEKNYLKPGADRVKKALVDDIKQFIMDNTF